MGHNSSLSFILPTVSRDSLSRRTLWILEDYLRRGVWGDFLPSERKLAETLQVSRMTLRQALSELERHGWITSGRGKRRRILGPSRSSSTPRRVIVLLTPLPLRALEPQMILLIHLLTESLLKKGLYLEVEARPSCFTRNPGKALASLADEIQPAGWIVFRGNQPVQEWFLCSGLPFVIVGSLFISNSPSFGSEHFAIGTHAAAQFYRFGHRHSAIIAPRHETVALSDENLIRGFKQAGLSCRMVVHDRTRKGILQSLETVLSISPKITGILTIGGQYSVTLLSALLHYGVAVPRDVSLVAMGNDPAFQYLVPSLAYYSFSIEKAAKVLFRLICRVVLEGNRSRSHIEIVPDFVRGESLNIAPEMETI